MKLNARVLVYLSCGLGVVVSCLFITAVLRTRAVQKRATQLLSITHHLAVGQTQESEAMRDVQPFLSEVGGWEKDEAQGDYRSFVFDNTDLSKLRLSRYRRFTIVLRFSNGVLSEKSAVFAVDQECRVEMTEREAYIPMPGQIFDSNHKNHFSTIPPGFAQRIAVASIVDDTTYPESSRELDWDFNLSQLARFGGCNDSRTLLPALSR